MLLADTQGLPSRTANPSPALSLSPSFSVSPLNTIQPKETFQSPSPWPPINQTKASHAGMELASILCIVASKLEEKGRKLSYSYYSSFSLCSLSLYPPNSKSQRREAALCQMLYTDCFLQIPCGISMLLELLRPLFESCQTFYS